MIDMRETIRLARRSNGVKGGLPWSCYLFDGEFPGFDGHFPGQPVLPGVCMLQAAVVTLEDWLVRSIRIQEISRARFVSPLGPGQELEVRCIQYKQADGVCRAHLALRGAGDRKTSECTLQFI